MTQRREAGDSSTPAERAAERAAAEHSGRDPISECIACHIRENNHNNDRPSRSGGGGGTRGDRTNRPGDAGVRR